MLTQDASALRPTGGRKAAVSSNRRRWRDRRLAVERLEARALLAAFPPGDLIGVASNFGEDRERLVQIDPRSARITPIAQPYEGSAMEFLWGGGGDPIAAGRDGKAYGAAAAYVISDDFRLSYTDLGIFRLESDGVAPTKVGAIPPPPQGQSPNFVDLEVDPDGSLIAAFRTSKPGLSQPTWQDARLVRIDPETGAETSLTQPYGIHTNYRDIAVGLDGRIYALASNYDVAGEGDHDFGLFRIDPVAGTMTTIPIEGEWALAVNVMPDGSPVVFYEDAGAIRSVNVASGQETRLTLPYGDRSVPLELSHIGPNSEVYAFVQDEAGGPDDFVAGLYRFDLTTDSSRQVPFSPDYLHSLTVVPGKAAEVAWNVKDGGVNYKYLLNDLPGGGTTAGFYWSDDAKYDAGKDTFVASTQVQGRMSTFAHIGEASLMANPTPATNYLLFVIDTDRVYSLAYDPQAVVVDARYDGNASADVIGRFFAIPGEILDQTFTVRLSDPLAALRPTLTANGTIGLKPAETSSAWDGLTYVTDDFDPGTLPTVDRPGDPDTGVRLNIIATRSGETIKEADSPRFHVEEFPRWLADLGSEYGSNREDLVKFVPVPGGKGGDYVFQTVLVRLRDFEVKAPDDAFLIGGRSTKLVVDHDIIVTAPLGGTPRLEGLIHAKFELLGVTIFDRPLRSGVSDDFSSFDVTFSTGGIKPFTLEPEESSGFGISLRFTTKESSPEKTLAEGFIITPIFVVLEPKLKLVASYTIAANATLLYVPGSGIRVDGGGTSIALKVTGQLRGELAASWSPAGPLKVVRLLQRLFPDKFKKGVPIPELAWINTLVGQLSLDAQANFGGDLLSPTIAGRRVEGGIDFLFESQVKLTVGSVDLLDFALFDPIELVPKDKKLKMTFL
ncbi:hypothetical protein OJF2_01110 [Aquisphaera giovannonii]|uniref:Uncharacterized protein n=1 Tax=Aquisphaera giovannonii TaxID=406548 RepID=A0A5B9VT24_9BACT|nr:hypothetical protein [Aquisphaera giovannonii]QEH31646.1 hypothetical protein OJF2_01110 [Aquisphaera giovannonii]